MRVPAWDVFAGFVRRLAVFEGVLKIWIVRNIVLG